MPTLRVERRTGHGRADGNRARTGQTTAAQLRPVREWTPRPARVDLLERGRELARIEQTITALRHGHGGVLIIEGAAGIGKSTLLQTVCEHAAGQGVQTFTARASELEREFGFGVVRQLLETRLVCARESERAELLAGAARLAGPVLGLGGRVGDPFAALHGLYWLVANLANGGPLLLAVDDVQWADESSLRWLIYLRHRLEGLPVLLAATTRVLRPGHSPLLAELITVGAAEILRPGPLSESAVAALIIERLGTQPDRSFVTACAEVTSGNPYGLRELIFDLAADGIAPVAAQAAGVRERVPNGVEHAVLARLGRLDQAAVRVARAVAVLGEGSGLRLTAALAELDIDAAARAVDALLGAELITECWPLHFVHPMVRSAIYEQIPSGARAQAHARAAQLLAKEKAEPVQVAMQLLACEPAGDADAVRALRGAAAAALARGTPDTAITYLRRALAEPTTETIRAVVLGELGAAERIARDPAAATHLDQAWQASTDPLDRARLAAQLANVLFYAADLKRCFAVLQAGLNDLGDRDADLASLLHAHKALELVCGVHPTEAPDVTFDRLGELAAGSNTASRAAQFALAGLLAARGLRCHDVAGLVERGWDGGRFLAEQTCEAIPAIFAGWALVNIDDLDGAAAMAEAMLVDAQARGSVVGFQSATGRRGVVALRRGALAEADADTRAALELASEHNLIQSVPILAAHLGLTLIERGELDQAASVIDGVTLDPTIVAPPIAGLLLKTRARVRLARGQRAQAIADLRRCGQLMDQAQLDNPNLVPWRSTLALALAADHPQQAWELAQSELRLARRVGLPRATGIALRACGLLAGDENGIKLLQESVAVFETTPMLLELAHSLTELGAALRRAGARVAARQPLRRALDLAVRCGAAPLAQRAREEALAAGARPRRPRSTGVDALTPSELRVARLAAQALGNREIAQALFITTKTVSDHLSSAYRKLNVSSRDQLSMAMSAYQAAL